MEDIRVQQIEALQIGIEYVQKLIPATQEIIPELRGDEKEDTMDFLNQIIDGINFVIEIVNATLSFINEKDEILNKDGIEEKVQLLNAGLQARDYIKVAQALEEGMLPFMDIFYQVASVIVAGEKS
nr:molecular chaperone [Lachnospiraceae bacterium]